MLHFLTPFLLFVSWLLSLLVSLSVPIIHTIFLWDIKLHASTSVLDISTTDVTGDIKFGLWGYCISQFKGSALGFTDTTKAQCTRASLGLHINPTLAQLLGIRNAEDAINSTLTSVLIIHPITCGLVFLAFLAALHAARYPSRRSAFVTILIVGFATLTGTIVFFIDIAVVAVSKNDIKEASDSAFTVTWGNAVWMSLGAVICLWAACVSSCFAVCTHGRRLSSRQQWDEKY